MSFSFYTGDCNIPANATLLYDILFVGIYKWRTVGKESSYGIGQMRSTVSQWDSFSSNLFILRMTAVSDLCWKVAGTVMELNDEHKDITVSSLFWFWVSSCRTMFLWSMVWWTPMWIVDRTWITGHRIPSIVIPFHLSNCSIIILTVLVLKVWGSRNADWSWMPESSRGKLWCPV